MPYARLFRNRWTALLWAGGILWTAVDVAQSAPSGHPVSNVSSPVPKDAMDDGIDAQDLAAIANAIGD